MSPNQSEVRAKRLAGLKAELSGIRAQFAELKKGLGDAMKAAAKRRDDWLLEHTRKEHL